MVVHAASQSYPAVEVSMDQLLKSIPPEDKAVRERCNYCEATASSFCASCKCTRYCSVKCQKKDHPMHKVLCRVYTNYASEKRPSPHHVRAIIFPADQNQPLLVWVEQKEQGGCTVFHHSLLLGDYATDRMSITELHPNDPDIGHGLVFLSRSQRPLPDATVNKSIMSLGQTGHMRTWFGNRLLIGMKRRTSAFSDQEIVAYDDVDLRDFRHAIDFFQQHQENPCIINVDRDPRPAVPAVIFYCEGAQRRFRPFGLTVPGEHVLIPRDGCIVADQDFCLPTLGMGLNWLYRRYPPLKEYHEKDITDANMSNGMVMNYVHVLHEDTLTPLLNPGTVVIFDNMGANINLMHICGVFKFMASIADQPEDVGSITQAMANLWKFSEMDGAKKNQAELEAFWDALQKTEGLEIGGAMAMVPTKLQPTLEKAIVDDDLLDDLKANLAAMTETKVVIL